MPITRFLTLVGAGLIFFYSPFFYMMILPHLTTLIKQKSLKNISYNAYVPRIPTKIKAVISLIFLTLTRLWLESYSEVSDTTNCKEQHRFLAIYRLSCIKVYLVNVYQNLFFLTNFYAIVLQYKYTLFIYIHFPIHSMTVEKKACILGPILNINVFILWITYCKKKYLKSILY